MTIRISYITPLVLGCALAGAAFGQGGSAAGTGAQAAPLPLIGRAPQTGQVQTTETPIAGTTASVNTINPGLQVSGPFVGSVPGRPFSGKLSLKEAIDRGLEFNLGSRQLSFTLQQAKGQAITARSALLPNINGSLADTEAETNLAAQGFKIQIPIPGFNFPTVVGPYNVFDVRARLTQSIADFAAINNYRSALEAIHANEFLMQDAKDLVVLAVGGAYLQTQAAEARVESEKAQLQAAKDLYDQTAQQRSVGLVAQIDVNKAEVQMLTHRQRMASLDNDLAKQKINLARLTGLPTNDHYELADRIAYADAPDVGQEDAVREALSHRPDIKAAEAQIRSAEKSREAVKGARKPSIAISADYGITGPSDTLSQTHQSFTVAGTVRIPIWQGGRYQGDLEQADAALDQRRAEFEDLKRRVESDVRDAFLDLQAAASQVEVARKNLDVAKETLDLAKQRLDAGVTDSVEVSQSQAGVAAAELDLINSIFAHNLAKLSLGRAQGGAADRLGQYLRLQ